MRPDVCGICLLKQTASGAQSVSSPSKIENFREFEADMSDLSCGNNDAISIKNNYFSFQNRYSRICIRYCFCLIVSLRNSSEHGNQV